MRRDQITVGTTYAKEHARSGRRAALDRTVLDIRSDGDDHFVVYESDAVIGSRSCSLSSFAAWCRRTV